MLQAIHRQICQQALEPFFSPHALEAIIQANLGQDALRNQFGHPEYHFDDNAFKAGNDYIAAQRRIVLDILQSGGEPNLAWQAFGRLTHAAQDFYAHSNYIRLWAEAGPAGELPEPARGGARWTRRFCSTPGCNLARFTSGIGWPSCPVSTPWLAACSRRILTPT